MSPKRRLQNHVSQHDSSVPKVDSNKHGRGVCHTWVSSSSSSSSSSSRQSLPVEPSNLATRTRTATTSWYNSSLLPILLLQRETFGGTQQHGSSWMNRMCFASNNDYKRNDDTVRNSSSDINNNNSNTSSSKAKWRPFCRRVIKFRDLKTETSDAVLGMDSTGSWLVALRAASTEHERRPQQRHAHAPPPPDLSLCLLALPSKAVSRTAGRSPTVVLNIPLGCDGNETDTTQLPLGGLNESSFFAPPAPARVPVRIWLCGPLGLCLYRHKKITSTTSLQSSSSSSYAISHGTVLLFPTTVPANNHNGPIHGHGRNANTEPANLVLVHTLKCVDLPPQEQIDESELKGTNLLWRVSSVPVYPHTPPSVTKITDRTNYLCETVKTGSPSYCFFIHEGGGGYRVTWIVENLEPNLREESYRRVVETQLSNSSDHVLDNRRTLGAVIQSNQRLARAEPINGSGWGTLICDRFTGELQKHDATSHKRCGFAQSVFSVSFSAIFSVASLLDDILKRRPNLVRPPYNHRTALEFPTLSSHVVQLSRTGQILELLMVFAVGHSNGLGCNGVFVEVDLFTQHYRELEWIRHRESDTPPASCEMLALERRRRLLDSSLSGAAHNSETCRPVDTAYQLVTSAPPCHDETLAHLYPDCQTLDNLAVRQHVPILSLSARSAPVEVIYV